MVSTPNSRQHAADLDMTVDGGLTQYVFALSDCQVHGQRG